MPDLFCPCSVLKNSELFLKAIDFLDNSFYCYYKEIMREDRS